MGGEFAGKSSNDSAIRQQNAPQAADQQIDRQTEILNLQRMIGNQAVMRLLRAETQSTQPTAPLQRTVELRPVGAGEASAFERREELVARLNAQTTASAVRYRLDGQLLRMDVLDEARMTDFDRRVQPLINSGSVIPLRLVTSAGTIRHQHIWVDDVDSGYVDLDDLLAADPLSFQMNFIHILTERSRVGNYEQRIGTGIPNAEVETAHQAALAAEAAHLQQVLDDPSIQFQFSNRRGRTTFFVFRSREGYQVVHRFRNAGQPVRAGEVFVLTSHDEHLTIDQFRAKREATQAAQ